MKNLYFIGVDGGGSKTSYVLIDQNKKIIKTYKNGPTTFDVISKEQFTKTIKEGITNVLPDNGDIASIFLGIGGVSCKNDELEICNIIKNFNIFSDKTLINSGNDIYNAFFSTFTNSGICLIVGTGSVIFGKDIFGNEKRLSGYGFIEGDVGSGYYIGLSALKILGKMYDGVTPFDNTFIDFSNKLGIRSKEDLIKHFNNASRNEIAKEAKYLIEHHENKHIFKILIDGANNYAIYVNSLCKQLPNIEKNLTIIGSCGLNEIYNRLIMSEINSLQPGIKYISHANEADFGAANYAYIIYNNKQIKR